MPYHPRAFTGLLLGALLGCPSFAQQGRSWHGQVVDITDGLPVPKVSVRLFDLQLHELANTTTATDGSYTLPVVDQEALVLVCIPGGSQAALPLPVGSYRSGALDVIRLNSIMDLPIKALVKDANAGMVIPDCRVQIQAPHTDELLFEGTTDRNGLVQGHIAQRRYGEDLRIKVTFDRIGYFPRTVLVDWTILTFIEQTLAGPEPMVLAPIELGTDLAKALDLPPIYFDLRESTIRPDAAEALDRLATTLRLDPSLLIDLRSHTDCRASAAFNDALSQRRAARTRSYLVGAGVAPDRITAKGWGEKRPINHCVDGVSCSEEEHQMNRRTEFIITACDGCQGPTALSPAK